MKIYAPVKDANGLFASVMFVNGVGETDDLALIDWFSNHGYKIGGESQSKEVEIKDEPKEESIDFDKMTPNELREWASKNGLGGRIKNTRNREKLLEIVRGD